MRRREHEPSDADDRPVPIGDLDRTDPPIDDDDRDPALSERQRDVADDQPIEPTDEEPASD
jgi:hypothetical protein